MISTNKMIWVWNHLRFYEEIDKTDPKKKLIMQFLNYAKEDAERQFFTKNLKIF